MKVCLVNPPFLFPRRRDAVHSHCLGLRSLSAYLRSLGHEVSFVDALLLGFRRVRREDGGCLVGLTAEETASLVPADVELIGVSAPFSQAAREVHGLLDVLAARFPDARLVMGGVYPAAQPGVYARAAAAGNGFRPGEQVGDLDTLPHPDRDIPRFDEYLSLPPRGGTG
ncbi:MAG: hypothetical protein ACYC5Q_08810 [Thermoleophilia bacterium]